MVMPKYRCKLCGEIVEGEDISVMEIHYQVEGHFLEVGLLEYLEEYVEKVEE